MYDIDIYNRNFKNNNMTYSIDMIRLKTYITHTEFSSIEFFVNSGLKSHIKKFWCSDRPMCFHYNYVIEFDDNSFWFGFMHNSEVVSYGREDIAYNLTIEFNPNKLKDNTFILYLLNKSFDWYIKSFDLAIDIPVNIRDLVFDLGTKRKIDTRCYGGDNITHTIGTGQGRVKIYNKKIESSLAIPGYLTRIEISIQLDDYPVRRIKLYDFDKSLFPCIFLNQYIFSFSDYESKDRTTLALLYAVQSRISY